MVFFVIALVSTFYALGANAVEGFVNYPSWRFIPEESFQEFHRRLDRTVPIWVVLPTFISTIAAALLIVFGPETIPKLPILAALALQIIGWVASVAIDIPIQISLSKNGWSETKVHHLIVTDRWFRQLPSLVSACLYVGLLWHALRL